MFVFRPELLFLSADGSSVGLFTALSAAAVAILGIIPLAAGIAGYLRGPLTPTLRAAVLVAAALLFYPENGFNAVNGVGLAILLAVLARQFRPKSSS